MKDFIKFTRFYLSLAVAMSGLFTYFAVVQTPSMEIFFPWLGILFLALGSSALNQIQEQKFDSLMVRTQNRPLPSGRYSQKKAFLISTALIFASFIFLYISMGLLGIYFTVATLIIYNLIYTYLKPITHWALILGSFLGVVSPTIGWLVANELDLHSLYDLRFMYIFILFFVWQVPHFWLLMLMNGDDYKNANFVTLKDKIGLNGMMRTIAIWNIICVLNGVAVILASQVSNTLWIITLVISAYLFYSSVVLFITQEPKGKFFKIKFMELNTYILLIMIFLIINNFS